MTKTYPPYWECIYCGATRYLPSGDRVTLADEHIIPEAIDGTLVLPEASCGECEGRINWFEQYCMKETFGPIRSHLNMKSKLPKERPKTVPVELKINDVWVTRDVPVGIAPVTLVFPLFDMPEILSSAHPTRTNIYTKSFLPRMIANGDLSEIFRLFGGTQGKTYNANLDGIRFGLLLAKIAHGYAMAEQNDLDHFNPVLTDTILRHPEATPLPFLVGGQVDIEPRSELTHELGLRRGEHPTLGVVWTVQIRLFGWLQSPTYHVVVSVEQPPPSIARNT